MLVGLSVGGVVVVEIRGLVEFCLVVWLHVCIHRLLVEMSQV